MQRSEEIRELATALAKSQSEFTPVPKNKTARVKSQRTNSEFTYKYADLADVLSMAVPILSRNGISISQPHVMVDGKLRVRTMLLHASGQWMMSDGIEINEGADPQSFGAESTYYRRYDGCSFIGVAPDEDTDAQQSASIGNGGQKKTTPAEAEKAKPKASYAPAASAPAAETEPEGVRTHFFARAKESGWSLGEIKKFIVKAYPDANGSTASLSEEQLNDALKVMKENKPEDVLKEAA